MSERERNSKARRGEARTRSIVRCSLTGLVWFGLAWRAARVSSPPVRGFCFCFVLYCFVSTNNDSSESIVPTIATELSVGALLVVLAMFWATLDIGQQHEDIPSLQNYQEFMDVYFVLVMERWFGNDVFSSGV